MYSTEKIVEGLKSLKPKLMNEYGVHSIGFFGSYANSKQTENSDLDIVVGLNAPLGWSFFEIQDIIEEFFNLKVDLVNKNAIRKEFKNNILQSTIFV